MRGYRPPPGPRVVMADVPPVTGVADLQARLDRRGFAKEDKLFFTPSDCEGALRSVEAGRDHEVTPRLADCLGAAGASRSVRAGRPSPVRGRRSSPRSMRGAAVAREPDMGRNLTVRLNDTHAGIWQENANDPTFHKEVFLGLLKHLGRSGWVVTLDEEIRKHHRCLSPNYRRARKGNLFASVHVSGRVVEIDIWAETWVKENQNGHRYDFDKIRRLDYLDRLRVDLTFRRLAHWLSAFSTVTVENGIRRPSLVAPTALDQIARRYAKCWHTDKALGRPICTSPSNCRSADGGTVTHGAPVWFVDAKGRLGRGVAYYNINSMWWIAVGRDTLRNKASFEIYVSPPSDLRVKRNERDRRKRLETEMSLAVRVHDFRRAETIRKILFGDQPLFRIWSSKNDAFYGSNHSGYTSDTARASLYTRAEAEDEVRRVPHLLSAFDLAGKALVIPADPDPVV